MYESPAITTRLATLWNRSVVDGWLQLLSPEATVRDYEQQLARVYGFESSVEAALVYAPGRDELLDMRPRTGFIVEDLLALGMHPARLAQLPQCAIEPFGSLDEAAGWLYVVERAAQVHEAVLHHLDARVPEIASACRYLMASSLCYAARRERLAATLARCDDERVVATARVAIERAADWYRIGHARAA